MTASQPFRTPFTLYQKVTRLKVNAIFILTSPQSIDVLQADISAFNGYCVLMQEYENDALARAHALALPGD